MAVMHYTDTALIATYLKRSLTDNEEASLLVIMPAIDKYINTICSTTFLEATDYTTRYYDGGEGIVDIEPATDVQDVTIVQDDGTLSYAFIPTMNWQAYPLGETVKTEIKLRYGKFPEGDSRIAVRAKFSSWDGGVPQDIQMAATALAVDFLKLGAVGTSNAAREELEGHKVMNFSPTEMLAGLTAANPIVRGILDQHREILL